MVIDTNILIAYLNGEDLVVNTITNWKENSRALFVSSITRGEVLALPRLSSDDITKIKLFLAAFISIQLDDTLAEASALLCRKYRLSLPDAAIAASAIMHSVPLVTRDRQFRKIPEIVVVEI